MLVLSRKENESLILTDRQTGRSIEVKVAQISGNRTKIAIQADSDILIMRKELVSCKSA